MMSEETKFCCDTFKKLIPALGWMKLIEEDKYLMPHIASGDIRYRVNNCPSCGAEVRSIELTKDEYETRL